MNIKVLKAALAGLVLSMSSFANAGLIVDFEDLTTRNNFHSFGINGSYSGFTWGYGSSSGVSNRTFASTDTGWASATTTDTIVDEALGNVGGSSYAWNWNGPQSLWIDFGGLRDFTSGTFSTLGADFASNSSSVSLFGYSASDVLLGSSSTLSLSHSFQTLTANFENIRYLEIRGSGNNRWFTIDNLSIDNNSTTDVPEPSTLAIFALGMIGIASRRFKKQS